MFRQQRNPKARAATFLTSRLALLPAASARQRERTLQLTDSTCLDKSKSEQASSHLPTDRNLYHLSGVSRVT